MIYLELPFMNIVLEQNLQTTKPIIKCTMLMQFQRYGQSLVYKLKCMIIITSPMLEEEV